jgi:putative methyltransferase (TIGR04325 family)
MDFNFEYIWQGKFDNYVDALMVANQQNSLTNFKSAGGFDSQKWHKKQLQMLETAREPQLPRPTTILEVLEPGKYDNLIDLGGGPAWLWAYLIKTNSVTNLNYFNIELDSSTLAFGYLVNDLPNMKFINLDEVHSLKGSRNLLYSNSVLQYFQDNSELLRIVEDAKPLTIILDDVAGEQEEFFSLQNYYGFFQVNRFINLNEIIQQLCNAGYQLMFQKLYEKSFSPKMVPRIWLGKNIESQSALPPSWSLAFARY